MRLAVVVLTIYITDQIYLTPLQLKRQLADKIVINIILNFEPSVFSLIRLVNVIMEVLLQSPLNSSFLKHNSCNYPFKFLKNT
jgi:hypothetical protein